MKDRRVWAFLFPLFALCGSLLFYQNTTFEFYLLSIGINLLIVIVIILINYLFAKYVLKKRLLKEVLGLGDVLFFLAFSLSFPTISFINFFVFSMLFAFIFHLILKRINTIRHKTIPLAGSMSLFLLIVYLINWMGVYNEIYIL